MCGGEAAVAKFERASREWARQATKAAGQGNALAKQDPLLVSAGLKGVLLWMSR